MSTKINTTLAACGLALAAALLCAPQAYANTEQVKKPAAAKPKSKAPAKPEAAPEEPEPDVADTTVTEYNCELGNKITI